MVSAAEEDETLIELKRDGFNSQEIYDSRRLDRELRPSIVARAIIYFFSPGATIPNYVSTFTI
jgi:hypothetical protein